MPEGQAAEEEKHPKRLRLWNADLKHSYGSDTIEANDQVQDLLI